MELTSQPNTLLLYAAQCTDNVHINMHTVHCTEHCAQYGKLCFVERLLDHALQCIVEYGV